MPWGNYQKAIENRLPDWFNQLSIISSLPVTEWLRSSMGESLTYWGLREIVRRRSKLAKVETPSLHSFLRGFAINMLRAGVYVFSLQKQMGYDDLQVLRRYLAQQQKILLKRLGWEAQWIGEISSN